MRIARLDVDEGFLDGLAMEFSHGLNVLIGARGVGKTSVIEILRFVLGADWFTTDAEARSQQQVRSVLGSGLARVTLVDGDDEIVVIRGVRDERPRTAGTIPEVTVLAQNEVEAVGAQPQGRLGLLDRLVSGNDSRVKAGQIVATLRSLGRETHDLRLTVRRLQERIEEFSEIDEVLTASVEEQQAVLQSVEATREEQEQLERLRAESAALAAQHEVLTAASEAVTDMKSSIGTAEFSVRDLPSWPEAAGGEDFLAEAREQISSARAYLARASEAVARASESVDKFKTDLDERQAGVEGEARKLRVKLDSLHQGLGAITRRVDELREKIGQRDALNEQITEAQEKLNEAAAKRQQIFADVEEVRTERYEERAKVAEWLNEELAPHIRVGVRRAAARSALAAKLVELLKGSGLHYNRLAPQVAEAASPLELVQKVEEQDPAGLAELIDIPTERAHNLVSYLYDRDLTELLVAPIEDAADLWLLDGADYKPARNLSIGQRCTAVLPILLRSRSDLLIVDQPEDHLDNAFISGTLVSTLRNRSADTQFIFASHNANVPVLGEADRIIYMDSDGKRGFVRHQGRLDEPESVRAVTVVMEGGKEAFQRRAEFYASYI